MPGVEENMNMERVEKESNQSAATVEGNIALHIKVVKQ